MKTAQHHLHLAKRIINSSSRPEIRSLFVELTQTLDTTSLDHYNSALKESQRNAFPTERSPIVAAAYKQILKDANESSEDYSHLVGVDGKGVKHKPKLSMSNA